MNAATQPSLFNVNRKSILRLSVGVLIAGLMMWLASRQVEWDGFTQAFADVKPHFAFAAVAVLMLTYVSVAIRWSLLLPRRLGASPSAVFPAVMIGYLVNTVLPIRIGDVARAAVLRQRFPGKLSSILGTIYSEHLLNLLMLVGVMAIFALVIDLPVAARTTLLIGSFAALIVTTAIAILSPSTVEALLRKLPHSERWSGKVESHLAGFIEGFAALKSRKNLVLVILSTGMIWFFLSLSAFTWALAFDLDVPWYGIVFALMLAGLGAAIPATPSAIGTYQVATVLALSIWSDDSSTIFVYSIVVHASQLIANVLLGGLFAIRHGIRSGRIFAPLSPLESK